MTGLIQSGFSLLAASMPDLRPPAASTIAQGVDNLYFALTAISLFFTVLIFGFIFYFMIRYRRRSPDEAPPPETKDYLLLEIVWTAIPVGICAVLFVWGAILYVHNSRPPASSSEIFVIGKQWMWQIQHPEGVREIDELHVPVNTPIKLTMTSQDVIHDFYIPAFRVKKDVLPGRYTSIWFEANQTGTFHLFCAQYCGAEHSGMIGWVYVMNPTDYAAWLSGGVKSESMAQTGERLFSQFGCNTCHTADGAGRGPALAGVYGKPEKLSDGQSKVVDEAFIRQAIVNPNSITLPGYLPVMPTYKGQITEAQVLDLIAYVQSLGSEERKSNGK